MKENEFIPGLSLQMQTGYGANQEKALLMKTGYVLGHRKMYNIRQVVDMGIGCCWFSIVKVKRTIIFSFFKWFRAHTFVVLPLCTALNRLS